MAAAVNSIDNDSDLEDRVLVYCFLLFAVLDNACNIVNTTTGY